MPQELELLKDRLGRLLDALEGGNHPGRARFEETLTDGYAWALKLDAECSLLERSIGELAAGLGADSGGAKTRELSARARRLERVRRDLGELRGLLASLRAESREPKVA